jgi:multiple sugar transport system ATP-binding protein
MNDSAICQVDTPKKLYEEPGSVFVAEFTGNPRMNIFPASVSCEEKCARLSWDGGVIELPAMKGKLLAESGCDGKNVFIGIRPEDIRIAAAGEKGIFTAEFIEASGNDSDILVKFKTADTECTALVEKIPSCDSGESITLAVDAGKIHVFDRETEKTLIN